MPSKYAPKPWEPKSRFDWATGGRSLSEEELRILRKLMVPRDASEPVERLRAEFEVE